MTERIHPDERDVRLLVMTEMLKAQGWGKATIAISRGGTMTVDVEAGEAKAAAREWRAK